MRRVLLLGASGFVGSALAAALIADGHEVHALGRDLPRGRAVMPGASWQQCDLRRMASAGDWAPFLVGVDVIVNASGALQSGLRDDVELVQDRAIRALVEAAARAGVAHFIQVSAAYAAQQVTSFMQSKARADAALAASGVPYTILLPGLMIGRNSFGGTELLRACAGLPIAVEISGTGPLQCIALADVVAAMRRALADPAARGRFDLVEAEPRSLGTIIALHRAWLGLPPPRLSLRLPVAMLRPAALLADALGWLGWRSPLRSNALAALVHGVRGDVAQSRALLGREPLTLAQTFAALGPAGKADRWHARIAPLYALALASLVLLWLAGGVVGLVWRDTAAALLAASGISPGLAMLLVIGGSLADIAIGLAILYRPTLKPALTAGAMLAAGYALGASVLRPSLWLDPLGSVVKIVPLIALMLLCRAMAEER